ncbi:MAG: helix-turn-helix transcriptional regulator [Devosia sp.]
MAAELALTPGLALVRIGERADLLITDRRDAAAGQRTLLIGDGPGRAGGVGVSALASHEPRLIVAAAMLIAAGYRLEAEGQKLPETAPGPTFSTLTARERQVAELLVEGASNKVIARRLEISVHTAKFHVGAVLEKLGAVNRSDAVAIALRDGLVAL